MKLGDKLVVHAGQPVHLADWDPADTLGFDKEAAQATNERSIARLDELQYLMYAEHRRALLVVLHGMDGAGKDSTAPTRTPPAAAAHATRPGSSCRRTRSGCGT